MSGATATPTIEDGLYDVLTGDDEGRVCRDIPESACNDQPRNFLLHVGALAATKTGDGLADPKLVLAWLLTALGAPAALIGLLVPVREAGALLPQLVTAGAIRALPRRKWVWAAGSVVQGLAVMGMGLAALTLTGAVAGGTIIALLAVFAVARSVCSVSHKDVLGKTVSKATRGTATGTAGTASAAAVLIFGALLALGALPLSVPVIAGVLLFAGGLWIGAGALFTALSEEPGATEGGGNALQVARQQVGLLREDPQLVRFIAVRALLIGTALAPPYLVALSGAMSGRALGTLGPFVIAAALAGLSSTYIWGRFADRSSRQVLRAAGVLGGTTLALAAVIALIAEGLYGGTILPALLIFGLYIAYQGVRLGRSTHIVDMAEEDTRAAYTALSNTVVGVVLLAAGAFGALASLAGTPVVIALFALMCLGAAVLAHGLDEVQAEE